MASPQLSSATASASSASERAQRALVGLAEALGTPEVTTEALAEAMEAARAAEVALEGLDEARQAAVTAVAELSPEQSQEEKRLYQRQREKAAARAVKLERELGRNRRRQRVLSILRNVSVGLLVVCSPLLSLDAVREALGVTQESHLVPSLATISILCQLALMGAEKAQGHLATAAEQQRDQASRYDDMARAAATKVTKASGVTEALAAADAIRVTLEEVTGHLRGLVDSVTCDLELALGFDATTRALGVAVRDLGTVLGDKKVTQQLARALEALQRDA